MHFCKVLIIVENLNPMERYKVVSATFSKIALAYEREYSVFLVGKQNIVMSTTNYRIV